MLRYRVVKETLTEYIEDNLQMDKEKGMELFNGIMDKYSRDSGRMEPKTVMELGNHPRETFIKDNGK